MGQKRKEKSYLKKGDLVQIISGQKKGILGNVILINKKKQKISIKEVFLTDPKNGNFDNQNESNRKLETIFLIHKSNLMVWDREKNKPTRVGYKMIDGEKKRYSKKSGNLI